MSASWVQRNGIIVSLIYVNKLKNCLKENMGLVSIKDKSQQVIVQGVHELYDLEETPVSWKDDTERTNRLVFLGRNLDKDILKQLFIATVTETEKQWTTHFKEDQVCAVVGARDTMMIKADAALTFRSWSPDTDWRQAAVRCVTNAALDQPMVLGEQVDTPPLIFPLIAAWERRI
ncbi:putative COBW domain-containing protein 7 isoform X1 [Pan troglodytes]|uniref:putative COBW domain-containing protein 7 isoform X1 n=2 Tax=Pan troglodytes TaxID=9598 RepID=UPI0030133A7D